MSKETDEKLVCTIYGFEIKRNSLYEVVEKTDHSAPDGYKEYNTTKVLSEQFEDSKAGAIFDSERSIWDTGLYPTSKAFKEAFGQMDDASTKILMSKLNNYIVTPFEKEKGEGALRQTQDNNEYWDNYQIRITRGKVFDTSKIDDLLNLYLLLIHRRLTPKEHESNPIFKQPISDYLIVDKNSNISAKAEKAKNRMKAISAFINLQDQAKERLISILDYIGIQASTDTDEDTLIALFERYLDDKEHKDQNAKIFIDAANFATTDEGEEILFIHKKLKELNRKSKDLVNFKKGEVYIDGTYVENGWKNAANMIYKNAELKEIFQNLYS